MPIKKFIKGIILSLATSTLVRSLKDMINFYRATNGMDKVSSFVAES